MTREHFRREMLAIANRHGIRAGEWRKMGDRFFILFLVLSVFDSFLASLILAENLFFGAFLLVVSVYSVWYAFHCRRRGMREEQESLRYRQEVLDGMWEELRR